MQRRWVLLLACALPSRIRSSSSDPRRPRRRGDWVVALGAAALLVAAGCASTADDRGAAATSSTPGAAVDTAPPPVDDVLTPLVITTLGPDPIPVEGSDGQVHVAYELSVLNFAPDPAVITQLDTLDGNGKVVTSLGQAEVDARTMVLPALAATGMPEGGIPAGATVLLTLDDVYADRDSVPATVTHRIAATFPPRVPDAGYAALWPSDVTQEGGAVRTSTAAAPVIAPPLSGGSWFVGSGCCAPNAHRFVLFPVDGGINGGERFAIDFIGVDPVGAVDPQSPAEVFHPDNDGSRNEDHLGYGASVIAVADATVVRVTSDVAEGPPGGTATADGLTINELGGNEVVLRLGPDLYAFYLHLVPGSPTVAVGDTVTEGQVIGRLGSSGNSTGPHLHFQLGTSPQFLTGRNVPYVFRDFTLRGTLTDSGLVDEPTPGERRDELPVGASVVDFPTR